MSLSEDLRAIETIAAGLPEPWNTGVMAALELVAAIVGRGEDPVAEIERMTTLAAQAIIDNDVP